MRWDEVRRSRLGSAGAREGYEEAWVAHRVGEQVRALREARGLSQRELGDHAGMSQPAIARLEAGGTNPTIRSLTRIASALHCVVQIDLVGQWKTRPADAEVEAVFRSSGAEPGTGA